MSNGGGINPQTIEEWGSKKDANAVGQLIQALENNPDLRWDAAWALGQIRDRSAVPHLINVLEDTNPNVRKRTAYSLGEIGDFSALNSLRGVQEDSDQYVRQGVEWALGRIYEAVETIVFGTVEDGDFEETVTLQNHDFSEVMEALPNLQRILVDAETCDSNLIENLSTYARTHLEQQLRNRVNVTIGGDFSRLGSTLSDLQEMFRDVELQVEEVVFGTGDTEPTVRRHVLQNPDFTYVTTARLNVQRIIVHASTAKSGLLNNFSKYAENHLNDKIPTIIYGDPQQLGKNTYKKFKQYCQWDYTAIQTIIFGQGNSAVSAQEICLWNPEPADFTAGMSKLQRLIVHAENADNESLNSFFTFAKDNPQQIKVSTVIYGDPQKLEGDTYKKFEQYCQWDYAKVQTILFGMQKEAISVDVISLWNPDLAAVETSMSALQQLVVQVNSVESRLLDNFSKYAEKHLVNRRISTVMYGDPQKLGEEIYKKFERYCQWDYTKVQTILFGTKEGVIPPKIMSFMSLWNPDLGNVETSMSTLRQIIVHAATCDKMLLHHFFTYVHEHFKEGRKHLKEHVEVVFYGDPAQFDTNLYNNFENLCKDPVNVKKS